MIRTILFLFAIVFNAAVCRSQELLPIDSLYLRGLASFSQRVPQIQDEFWPGMTIGPSCVFRIGGPAFLLNHPRAPKEARLSGLDSIYVFPQAAYSLMGTSQTEINGVLTAHNNYGQTHYVSENQFFAELFHELHHVYQRNQIKGLKFDNPMDLLTYPEDWRNDAIKQYENELLLKMVTSSPDQFRKLLNEFYTCRSIRRGIIGEKYSTYEKRVESAEGPATYCEYLYMKKFSSTPTENEYINKRFFYSLVEPGYGREGLRNKFLLTGMVQCLLLSKHFEGWQNDYYNSGQTLNEYFFSRFKPQRTKLDDLASYEAKAKYFTQKEREKRQEELKQFYQQAGRRVTLNFKGFPAFRGFDPMHAESVGDSLILHSTLLKLGKGDNYFSAANRYVLTRIRSEVWFVNSLTFFVNDDAIRFEGGVFRCEAENLSIRWQYARQVKNGEEYVITVE